MVGELGGLEGGMHLVPAQSLRVSAGDAFLDDLKQLRAPLILKFFSRATDSEINLILLGSMETAKGGKGIRALASPAPFLHDMVFG